MNIALVLIVLGILVGVLLHGSLGAAMVVIGVVLLIWPHLR
jgi:hypothetical protein